LLNPFLINAAASFMYRARARELPNSNVLLALMKGNADFRDDVKMKNSNGKARKRMGARVGIWDSASGDIVDLGTVYIERAGEMKASQRNLSQICREEGGL
jgi:hypothetical protein